ncbi:MAG: 8-amino-7-oxononanoate synthase [Deltaproteobacteria bacterium]|nr:8-amino-7-oxononanoate synthase [Deltaproteobacteria bacterium]
MSLDDDARDELCALADVHRLRVPRVVDGRQGVRVVVDGAEVTSFASNDYLGLAGDDRLAHAAIEAIEHGGTGVGASRLIVGNHRAHVELEAAVMDWLGVDGVRLFNSGYAANTGVLTTLLREGDVVFSDELNHASIVDGCRLSRATIAIYRHRDLADLERAMKQHGGRRRIVVSETVFSMDGDVVDVEALAAVTKRSGASLILDEAHAMGVLGIEGRGVAAACRDVDVVIGTFGKALGSFGAFAATTKAIAELLWNRARSLVFSTGLPPSVAAASKRAIEIVRSAEGDERRAKLSAITRQFRAQVPRAGGSANVPIASWVIGDDRGVEEIGRALLREGLLVASVRPPTVPVGTARLRISFSAGHEPSEIEDLTTITQRVIYG